VKGETPFRDARLLGATEHNEVMVKKDDVPAYYELINPTLRALHKLGGSASIQELAEEIVDDLNLPPKIAELPHGRGSQTEVEYRAAWARTYMRNAGLVENSDRGVWALTPEGTEVSKVDARKLTKDVQRQHRKARLKQPAESFSETIAGAGEGDASDWQEEVVETLLGIPPQHSRGSASGSSASPVLSRWR